MVYPQMAVWSLGGCFGTEDVSGLDKHLKCIEELIFSPLLEQGKGAM